MSWLCPVQQLSGCLICHSKTRDRPCCWPFKRRQVASRAPTCSNLFQVGRLATGLSMQEDCCLLGTGDKWQDGGPTSAQKWWVLHGQATPADGDGPLPSWATLRCCMLCRKQWTGWTSCGGSTLPAPTKRSSCACSSSSHAAAACCCQVAILSLTLHALPVMQPCWASLLDACLVQAARRNAHEHVQACQP